MSAYNLTRYFYRRYPINHQQSSNNNKNKMLISPMITSFSNMSPFLLSSSRPPLTRIAVRKLGADGSAQHPNTADHQDLTDTAYHELRFYRYYRFSEKIEADTQQRGFMAASFLFFYALVIYILMHIADHATQPRFFQIKRLSKLHAQKCGIRSQYQWQKDMFRQWKKTCDESLPALRAQGHDTETFREYLDECSLHECMKRDPEFHTSLLHVGFRLIDCPGTHDKFDSAIDSTLAY
jgi:hypothetical protein